MSSLAWLLFRQMMFKDLAICLVIVYDMPESAPADTIDDINRCLENSQLQHRVTRERPLDDTVRSHELIEAGRVPGCVVVNVN